ADIPIRRWKRAGYRSADHPEILDRSRQEPEQPRRLETGVDGQVGNDIAETVESAGKLDDVPAQRDEAAIPGGVDIAREQVVAGQIVIDRLQVRGGVDLVVELEDGFANIPEIDWAGVLRQVRRRPVREIPPDRAVEAARQR